MFVKSLFFGMCYFLFDKSSYLPIRGPDPGVSVFPRYFLCCVFTLIDSYILNIIFFWCLLHFSTDLIKVYVLGSSI